MAKCPKCGVPTETIQDQCNNCGYVLVMTPPATTGRTVRRIVSERNTGASGNPPAQGPLVVGIADDADEQDTAPDLMLAVPDETMPLDDIAAATTMTGIPTTSETVQVEPGYRLADRLVLDGEIGTLDGHPVYAVTQLAPAQTCWNCHTTLVDPSASFCTACDAALIPTVIAVQHISAPVDEDTGDLIVQDGQTWRLLPSIPVLDVPAPILHPWPTYEVENPHGHESVATLPPDTGATSEIPAATASGLGQASPDISLTAQETTIFEQNEAPTLADDVLLYGRGSSIPHRFCEIGIASDVGRARQGKPNEDSSLATLLTLAGDDTIPPLVLCIVADGLGGHENGQEAGRIAVNTISQSVIQHLWFPLLQGMMPAHPDTNLLVQVIDNAIQAANQVIVDLNYNHGHDMGCTVTALLALGDRACVANVGDSRTYAHDGESLRQITEDHSIVARYVLAGMLEPDELYTHPNRSQIYRSLGDEHPVKVDTFPRMLVPGETYLLCSDGLWEMVRDPELAQMLDARQSSTAQGLADAFIARANFHGGDDNVTAIVVKVLA